MSVRAAPLCASTPAAPCPWWLVFPPFSLFWGAEGAPWRLCCVAQCMPHVQAGVRGPALPLALGAVGWWRSPATADPRYPVAQHQGSRAQGVEGLG